MSRLTDLIAQTKAKDPQLGADLEREFRALSSRLAFGLNFERHRPEAVELPGRPVRRGDKVRILPERGSKMKGDQRLWLVKRLHGGNLRMVDLELFEASAMLSASHRIWRFEFSDNTRSARNADERRPFQYLVRT